MKTYRVEFTPDARQDMIAYARYIAHREQNDRHALAWYDGMHKAVMGLATMPNPCDDAKPSRLRPRE